MEENGFIKETKETSSYTNTANIFKEEFTKENPSESAFRRSYLLLWRAVKKSKNPWYYWYTGSKFIAIQAWLMSFCTLFAIAALASGGGMIKILVYIFLGVVLENLAIIIFLAVLISDYYFLPVPDPVYPKLLLPVLASAIFAFVVNRLSVFIVLKSRPKI